MNPAPSKPASSSKVAILDAAEELFAERGYRDTTVADIARVAGMSPANLYRHFENKEDIAAGCCYRRLEKKNQALREVLEKKRLNATERLEEFTLALLRYTYEDTQKRQKMNQVIEVVIASRPEVFYYVVSSTQSMIAEILAQGNAQKEFAVENVVTTAETVLAALAIFFNPLFMHLYPLPEFERRARATAHLLVQGLACR
ncbi:MAG: TetR/AcrR family transcriptional regulator [Acidobacteriia bacterium]|nr:TetR/AcrR family transcriptional regulator [Terriglobia bacterium]